MGTGFTGIDGRKALGVLERKVDKMEMEEALKAKSSKHDAEMSQRQIGMLHKQINMLSMLLTR